MEKNLQEILVQDYLDVIENDGVQQLKRLTEMLNSIILEDGEVKQNNSMIWDEFLHEYSNKDWAKMLIVLQAFAEAFPEKLKSNEENAFNTAEMLLAKNWNKYERILDRKTNKFYAWKAMMSALDFINRINDYNPYQAYQEQTPKASLFYVES